MAKYKMFTSKEIKPAGWIKNQLLLQAEGLCGNLDKIWTDVRASRWFGGEAEGWERAPYWLNGFIPMAYLLENEEMIEKSKKYIDIIISRQEPDGWICPCTESSRAGYDTWALLLITKVLVVYYECSGDERIPEVIYKVLKNYYDMLSSGKIKLHRWGKYRYFEGFMALNFLKERYKDKWIKSLALLLCEQGQDYTEIERFWERPLNKWTRDTHGVNLAMMLKSEAASCDILGREYTDLAEHFVQKLSRHNGTPVGLFTGDECLSGLSAIQGTELCAVVEQMYSYELLYAYTGDKKWAERLEVLAFNALPAAISEDMWSHQFVQMSNQISCERLPGRSMFRTIGNEAHLFGLEPNHGCCTVNFGQGWPRFILSAFMHSDKEIISVIPIPSTLDCEKAKIVLTTDYPFENKLVYRVRAKKKFTFKIRTQSFAKNLTVNGRSVISTDEIVFELRGGDEREITVCFDTQPQMIRRPHSLYSVKCGSLVFSLPIEYKKIMHEYKKDGVERKFPYCDWEYKGSGEFGFAFASDEFRVSRHAVSGIPFSQSHPPVTLSAKMQRIDWGYEDGFDSVCAKVPQSLDPVYNAEIIKLIPYGCARLRMTEMPKIEK